MSNTTRGLTRHARLGACMLLALASAACSQYQAAKSEPVTTSAAIPASTVATSGLKPLELTDIMQFRELSQRQLSENQQLMVYTAVPDWGDSTGYVVNLLNGQQHSVPLADKGQLNADGSFALFRQRASLLAREQAPDKKAREALEQNAVLVNTETGTIQTIANIDRFAFTGDGRYALLLARKSDEKATSQQLQALHLASGKLQTLAEVTDFSVAKEGGLVAFISQQQTDGQKEGDKPVQQQLQVWDSAGATTYTVLEWASQKLQQLQFNPTGNQLAVLAGSTKAQLADPKQAEAAQQLWLWSFDQKQAQQLNTTRPGWLLSEHYTPHWSKDGKRLFIGHRPQSNDTSTKLEPPQSVAELYDVSRLLADRRLQVWHGDDKRINSQQKAEYQQALKRTAAAVIWLDSLEMVVLSDDVEEQLQLSEHSEAQLISTGRPHLKTMSWNGRLHDSWHINLRTGKRQQVFSANRSHERAHLSPSGRYVVYLQHEQYQLFDSATGRTIELTTDAPVSWVDEQNDRPMAAASYGVAGWLADETAVLIYDRFDIWALGVNGSLQNLTNIGRAAQQQYRLVRTDEELALDPAAPLLLSMYNEANKRYGFARLDLNADFTNNKLTVLLQGKKRYDFVEALALQKQHGKKQDQPQQYLFTEQSFRQFPDLWLASEDFSERRQLTALNPQQAEFIWGDSHLIEWDSTTGEPLQGVLLTPDGYDASKPYPVVVYYYEKFSQRLHHYNQMKVNHRPNFPYYLGQGYLVFLPDIHFRDAAPGPSATESLVPGLQQLIELGIADPNAIGLHGHSWSGYQTAFVVTETDMFAAAVSGAPVANMTSAYSGIRWQTGLARQFQYETGQSRLGESMYANLKPYIDNSPVFFADQINTPMLIQFGDDDGAVPWEQGIEYYLALRRLDKEVVMLHYEGEPHHLQRYANKLDYSIKMREFFDHYLKGAPAPLWWTEGMPYQQYDKK